MRQPRLPRGEDIDRVPRRPDAGRRDHDFLPDPATKGCSNGGETCSGGRCQTTVLGCACQASGGGSTKPPPPPPLKYYGLTPVTDQVCTASFYDLSGKNAAFFGIASAGACQSGNGPGQTGMWFGSGPTGNPPCLVPDGTGGADGGRLCIYVMTEEYCRLLGPTWHYDQNTSSCEER